MYTTRLLNIIDDRMPRRHQLITAAIVVFLALGSIVSSVTSRPAHAVVQPAIILIATPTMPAGAGGLAKAAAPLGAAPTVAPTPTRGAQTASAPDEQTGERPSDKPAPPRSHERTTDKAGPHFQ